jgi:hypothetical protein
MALPSSFWPKEPAAAGKRDVQKVPFVELYDGRLQGVVSSGSDIERVYVSFFEAGSLDYYCSTNNNRPCGGLRGTPCKHLDSLVKEAVAEYGLEPVARFLRLPGDVTALKNAGEVMRRLHSGSLTKNPAGQVFSRFLNYLRYLELAGEPAQPLPEMSWFV